MKVNIRKCLDCPILIKGQGKKRCAEHSEKRAAELKKISDKKNYYKKKGIIT